MNETLTPQDAALAIARANQWEDRIVHRTEGVTWMIWGLITAAIWVTMTAMSRGPMNILPMTISWGSWVLAGFVLTYAVWRSAALTKPDAIQAPPWWTYFAKVAGITLAIVLLHVVIKPTTPAYPLAIMGFLWIAMALLSRRWSRLGKITAVAIGMLVILGGLVLPYAVHEMDGMMLSAAAVGGIIPLAGGFYQTLRG